MSRSINPSLVSSQLQFAAVDLITGEIELFGDRGKESEASWEEVEEEDLQIAAAESRAFYRKGVMETWPWLFARQKCTSFCF